MRLLFLIFTFIGSAYAQESQWRIFFFHAEGRGIQLETRSAPIFTLDGNPIRVFEDLEVWRRSRPSQSQFCLALIPIQNAVEEKLLTTNWGESRLVVESLLVSFRRENGDHGVCEINPNHEISTSAAEILCSELCASPNS